MEDSYASSFGTLSLGDVNQNLNLFHNTRFRLVKERLVADNLKLEGLLE